jgi:ferritin
VVFSTFVPVPGSAEPSTMTGRQDLQREQHSRYYHHIIQGEPMLSTQMLEKLNAQITVEFFSSNLYLQMSAWCSHNGYAGCAKFLLVHSLEERTHMEKFFHYVDETGGLALIDAIAKPASEFKGLVDIFTQTLEHEKYVTACINALVDFALETKDYATFNFLQWFIGEQHEEENLFATILDKIKMIGTEGRGMYLIDKEIGKLAMKD